MHRQQRHLVTECALLFFLLLLLPHNLTFSSGCSSSSRRQKVAQVPKFLSLKNVDMADRRLSARCTRCRLQCVKYAASSAVRAGSSLTSRRASSMRSAML